jgi:hypothetical protein
VKATVGDPASKRLVEAWFPYVEISRLVAADRRSKDAVYGIHKWFARRPPTLVRALLLAAHLDATTSAASFWKKHEMPGAWLAEAVVYDPFMGGGTSLVESARMGASVFGRDVDPVAVAVVGAELQGPSADFEAEFETFVAGLSNEVGEYFAGPDPDWLPLHWFWLTRPVCAKCNTQGLLYKDLVVATSSGRDGSVVRDDAMHAFCPACLAVYGMRLDRKEIRCCGARFKIDRGTYRQGKYHCPTCGEASSHDELQTGRAERVLLAVEETRPGFYRRIRSAENFDRECVALAETAAVEMGAEFDVELQTVRRDRRPVSAGFVRSRDLYTARQWITFTAAFGKVRAGIQSAELEREFTLAMTGAVPSNNALCSYARDWGRLAPLFSVRGYSIPTLAVELNPFHPTAGRGTLRSAKVRMTERGSSVVRRSRIDGQRLLRASVDLPVAPAAMDVACRSADDAAAQPNCVATICVTDPPYFDYIAYSELSEVFRTWLRDASLAGAPLLPSASCPVESFSIGLGGALKATMLRLEPGVPLVFTYHSAEYDAWRAIGDALDIANMTVVALWPVLADPHMGHHTADGNCEWDLVVVARRSDEVRTLQGCDGRDLPAEWLLAIERAKMTVGPGDRRSFAHAWAVSKDRFGQADTSAPLRKPSRRSQNRV